MEQICIKRIFDLAVLCGADLTEADLTGANLTGANVWGAYVVGTKLQNAIMPDGKTSE